MVRITIRRSLSFQKTVRNDRVRRYLLTGAALHVPMHELSIALNIIEIASKEAARHGATAVRRVNLRVGPLSGVVREALEFSFEAAVEETALSGAVLDIEEVPLTAWCDACEAERSIASAYDLRCPVCGAGVLDIRTGRELEITSIEIE